MNLWLDADDEGSRLAPSRSIEIGFRIDCRELPVDHAEPLSQAILAVAPWLTEDPCAAIHPVHVAGSQNGWERPERATGECLIPSRRTRLRLRVSRDSAAATRTALLGQALDIDGYALSIVSAALREPAPSATLIARYTVYANQVQSMSESDAEADFVDRVVQDCQRLGFTPTRLLCGKKLWLRAAGRDVVARSVLLADVPEAVSLNLQDGALGDWRLQGCGIPVPHKDTGAVRR